MAGHSKWANIKHKKAKEDAKRGKIFTKLIKEITVAAREGGGDPTASPRLRLLIDKAKQANMPAENIQRAIKKGTGELEGVSYESIRYEGYGPAGVAVIVEALTDNKNRTVADVRHVFTKHNGSIGADGSVSWMFAHKAVLELSTDKNEDDLLESFLDHNIDDIVVQDGHVRVVGDKGELFAMKTTAENTGLMVDSAHLEWVPSTLASVQSSEDEEKVYAWNVSMSLMTCKTSMQTSDNINFYHMKEHL